MKSECLDCRVKMDRPEMKRESELTASDFVRSPVWVGVHNFDVDQPWYEEADEETVRPWFGKIPFNEGRGTAIIAAQFKLADGSIFAGYCHTVTANWDDPEIAVGETGGSQKRALSWSKMHGGNPSSVILLQSPVMFAENCSFDFQLRIGQLRERQIEDFFSVLKRKPNDVFPIKFSGQVGIASGIISGTIEGFFSFPLWSAEFEVSTGESYLSSSRGAVTSKPKHSDVVKVANCEGDFPEEVRNQKQPDSAISSNAVERTELKLEDFQKAPIWVRTQAINEAKPFPPQYRFKPWTGVLPGDSSVEYLILPAVFCLSDGSEFTGYARAVPENWVDVRASATRISATYVIPGTTPRERFGGSILAIIGEHHPCLFVRDKGFRFWCGPKSEVEEVRQSFYEALERAPDQVFPIQFHCRQGLATGIISGEILGFYAMQWNNGNPPKIVR